MSLFGTAVPISLFGESHGDIMGLTIHHLASNITLDLDKISAALSQRKAKHWYHTTRREADTFEIVSGFFNGKTTGAPLTILMKNTAMNTSEYTPYHVRPNHADYPAYMRSHGAYDYRGGGHFSGRLTALLVVLGSIASQLLASKKILVASHIKQLHTVKLNNVSVNKETLDDLNDALLPVLDKDLVPQYEAILKQAIEANDSVGGIVQTLVFNLDVGLGEPFFDKLDALIAHLILALPGTKGIQFGDGFDCVNQMGSSISDTMRYQDGNIVFDTNHMGGVLGGLSTGNTLIFDTVIKPTPSIAMPLDTINLQSKTNVTQTLNGRHDPSIVPRMVPVINAITTYALLELTVRKDGWSWIKS